MPSRDTGGISWSQMIRMIDQSVERNEDDEQTDSARAEYRGRVGVTTRTVPSPIDLDVGQFDGTVGSDTLPVPERAGVDVVDGFGNRVAISGDACPEGSERVEEYNRIHHPYFQQFIERSNDMPNYTIQWNEPVTIVSSTISPYTLRYELGYTQPTTPAPPPPPTPRPEPRVNEIILSDDPVEQYYLTAISFFKGLKEPQGGSGRYGRTHTSLKSNIIDAMESELRSYKQSMRRLPGNHEEEDDDEEVRYRPARGRTR